MYANIVCDNKYVFLNVWRRIIRVQHYTVDDACTLFERGIRASYYDPVHVPF